MSGVLRPGVSWRAPAADPPVLTRWAHLPTEVGGLWARLALCSRALDEASLDEPLRWRRDLALDETSPAQRSRPKLRGKVAQSEEQMSQSSKGSRRFLGGAPMMVF